MLRVLQFIDHRDGKILHGNMALATRVNKQAIVAEPEFSGALARCEIGRRRQEGPVECLLVSQRLKKLASRGSLGLWAALTLSTKQRND